MKICHVQRCQTLLETHDDWLTSAAVLEILSDFDPEEAACLWDVEHPCHHGESPTSTANTLKRYVRHIHIKDGAIRDGKSIPRLLGEGDLPLDKIIAALREIGYDAWICLETEKRWHPETAPDPEQSIPQFVQYMRKHWG